MKFPKLRSSMRGFNQRLKSGDMQFKLYCKLLQKCVRTNPSPISDRVSFFLDTRDFSGLYQYADHLSSQLYTTASSHFEANQWAALIKKYKFSPKELKLDPMGLALSLFRKSEHRCRRTNQRFRAIARNANPYECELQRMRDFIAYVLGDVSLPSIIDNCGFGPGASVGVHGDATNLSRKLLADKWSVNPSAFSFAYNALINDPLVNKLLFPEVNGMACYDCSVSRSRYIERCEVADYNKIAFVPKTAKVHRTIAVEPLLTGYLQKGIDNVMRLRLKRIGIDLSSQAVNQRYAQFGSEDWQREDGFVTIDLASASDSIAIEVVRNLLPPDWFDLLNSCRPKYGRFARKLGLPDIRYEKFCSMGNGFCFPLETLIFAAACHASGAGKPRLDYVVYGDDIIVRRNRFPKLLKLLELLGFRLNMGKTHVEGPFRESCGEDYFGGSVVRPYTLDFRFDSLESIIKFLNGVQRNDRTRSFFNGIGYAEFGVPPELRFVRPFTGPDDAAVTVDLDKFMSSPYARWNKSCLAWEALGIIKTPVVDNHYQRDERYHIAQMYACLWGASSHNMFTFRRKSKTKLAFKLASAAPVIGQPPNSFDWLSR